MGTSQLRLVGLKLQMVSGDSLPMSLLRGMPPTQGSQGRIEVEIYLFTSAQPALALMGSALPSLISLAAHHGACVFV